MIYIIQRLIALWIIIVAASSFLRAQTIDNITVSPDLPTTDDSIFIYVQCTFPNMSCKPFTQDVFQDSSNIYASALHCVGSLTAICNYTDTFKFASLPAGDYSFYFTLNAGSAPEPCTPGIIPYDNDSAFFTVTTATGANNIVNSSLTFSIYPNPSNGYFEIVPGEAMNISEPYQLHVISLLGREVYGRSINRMSNSIHLNLTLGIYFCYLEKEGDCSVLQKLVISADK